MKKYAVIGDPIEHSLSPFLHRYIYKKIGIKAEYQRINVKSLKLEEFVLTNSLNGFNVTIPHKIHIINYLDEIDETAKILNSVNCIFNNKGYNTDWLGLKRALHKNDLILENKDCLILGSGGVSRSIIYALIKENINTISILNRNLTQKEELEIWIHKLLPKNKPNNKPDVIINCTPVGMWPISDKIPFDLNIFSDDQLIIDTIYNPYETQLIKAAKKSGAKILNGLDMFIFQAIETVNIWMGEDITEQLNFNNLKKELESQLCFQN
jgi:shikimate dehydrogenase